jgi:hypothetical protein
VRCGFYDGQPEMNIAEILIWESTNALLLIPVVIGIVMLTRWIRRRPAFTDHDWLFLFGHPREKVLSLHLWMRFAVLWFAVVVIGFIEGYVLIPFGLAAFLGAVLLTALVVWEYDFTARKKLAESIRTRLVNLV